MSRFNTSAITIPAENESMAQLVGMDEFEDQPTVTDVPELVSRARTRIEILREEEPERIIRAITYACSSCELEHCRRCEGTGFLAADVDDWEVDIDGVRYDRGIESDERIARALESVDEHCREDLEWLLRHGPSDDVDSPAMQAVIARAETEERAVVEPMGIMETLAAMVRVAVQVSAAPFREKSLAMAQLAGGAK